MIFMPIAWFTCCTLSNPDIEYNKITAVGQSNKTLEKVMHKNITKITF